MRLSRSASSLLTSIVVALTAACGGAPGGAGSSASGNAATGSLSAALTSVPSGVQCVKIALAPSGNTKLVSLAAGASTVSIDLGVLPIGSVTIDGAAYNQACNKIGSNDPSWVADEVTTQVFAGTATKVSLVFHVDPHATGTVDFVPSVSAMALGVFATYAVMADGTVRYWGYDPLTSVLHTSPTVFAGLSGVTSVAANGAYGCAILSDTTVKCWGSNDGTWSLLANGQTTANAVAPAAIAGLTGVVQLAAAEDHVCALASDQSIRCWGKNTYGALGDGTKNDAINAPVKSNLSGIQIASNQYNTFALQQDGSVTMDGKDSPAIASVYVVQNVTGAQQITVGAQHACAAIVDGTVSCWGSDGWGQLGDGTTNTPANPIAGVTVKGLSGAVQVAGYFLSTCALTASGQIFCWGENSHGELGDGHTEEEGQEQQISPNLPTVGIATGKALVPGGYYDACAILADSTVRCWGSNDQAGVGDGTTITRFVPVMPAF